MVDLTAEVATANVAVLAPLGIVIDAGAITAEFEVVSITTKPLAPAAEGQVMRPVDVRPPITLAGDIDRDLSELPVEIVESANKQRPHITLK